MTAPHPLSSRCTAKAKGTGVQCRHQVVGGGVCPQHGGKAPQVARKREERVVAGMLRLELGPDGDHNRSPGDMLLDAARDADGIVQQLRHSFLGGGQPDPRLLDVFGDWLDRCARINRLVADSRVDERQVALAESQGALLAGVIRTILARLLLTEEQRALVHVVVPEVLRSVVAGQVGPGRV